MLFRGRRRVSFCRCEVRAANGSSTSVREHRSISGIHAFSPFLGDARPKAWLHPEMEIAWRFEGQRTGPITARNLPARVRRSIVLGSSLPAYATPRRSNPPGLSPCLGYVLASPPGGTGIGFGTDRRRHCLTQTDYPTRRSRVRSPSSAKKGMLAIAKDLKVGTGTVQRIKREMEGSRPFTNASVAA
jgi:hypothetical protein